MTDAAHGVSEEQLAERTLSPGQAIYAGVRQPIVLILLLISFFTAISGKPLDGVLLVTVATLLVWDAARSPLAQYAGFPDPARPVNARSATAITVGQPDSGRPRVTRGGS